MTSNWTIVVLVVVLIAGCTGLPSIQKETENQRIASTSTSTSAPSDETVSSTQKPARLSFNQRLVFDRVRRLLDANRTAMPSIVVRNCPPDGTEREISPFYELMGVGRNDDGEVCRAGGYVPLDGDTVYIYSANASEARLKGILAHEFVHYFQFKGNLSRFEGAEVSSTARIEGTALYIQDVYAQRYLDQSIQPYEAARRTFRRGDAYEKYTIAPYYLGARYVRNEISDPQNLSRLYDSWPTTAEQLLHPSMKDGDSTSELSVRAEASNTWRPTSSDDEGRQGELKLRIALTTELADSRVRRAAAGWANDRLVTYHAGNITNPRQRTGYAWVLRFDNSREATEFQRALEAYLAKRKPRRDGRGGDVTPAFEAHRVAEETVVLFAGAPSFVQNATYQGNSSTVTVTP